MLLVLNPIKKDAVYITNGASRTEGSQTLSVPASYSGDAVECYIAFIGLDGSISSSKYAGEVIASVPR